MQNQQEKLKVLVVSKRKTVFIVSTCRWGGLKVDGRITLRFHLKISWSTWVQTTEIDIPSILLKFAEKCMQKFLANVFDGWLSEKGLKSRVR